MVSKAFTSALNVRTQALRYWKRTQSTWQKWVKPKGLQMSMLGKHILNVVNAWESQQIALHLLVLGKTIMTGLWRGARGADRSLGWWQWIKQNVADKLKGTYVCFNLQTFLFVSKLLFHLCGFWWGKSSIQIGFGVLHTITYWCIVEFCKMIF